MDSSELSSTDEETAVHPLVIKKRSTLHKSDASKGHATNLKAEQTFYSSDVSLKSDMSMGHPINFKKPLPGRCKSTSILSPESYHSPEPIRYSSSASISPVRQTSRQLSKNSSVESLNSDFNTADQTQLDPVFKTLKEQFSHFAENELQKLNSILQKGYQDWSHSPTHVDAVQQENEKAFLKIILNQMRSMDQNELADRLQRKTSAYALQHSLKNNITQKIQNVFEGIAKAGRPTSLNKIYTELYISGETTEVNDQHEVMQIETALRRPHRSESTMQCNNIFKGENHRIRTVLTKGVAGIGKTVLTQKFTLDWAEGKANRDKYFVFPFTFRQLNLLKDKKFSLVELVHHFFSETKDVEVSSFQDMQVVFILDGLDEYRLLLDFKKTKTISSVTETATVTELLVNLIRGDLLPAALIWITTRPAAASQIPAQCISLVTEVLGFIDPQKEQYFKNKFPEDKAHTVITHIKSSQSMYAMCFLPIFCWIAATILQNLLETRQVRQLPKTLTEMYVHFLIVQAKVKNIKYNDKSETDQHWSLDSSEMIKSLAKLAFEQLEEGNLLFYESDLNDCGINVKEASVYSGVFTEMFKEESGLYQEKVFCFVHLSVQEFLAAFHVHLTFFNTGVNLLSENQSPMKSESTEAQFYQTAVEKALQSHNGHLDLFLRFLLGLSLHSNQILLQGLLPKAKSSSKNDKETIQFIKKKLNENVSIERCINLFHCLAELNDRSLVNQIQWYLNSEKLNANELSASQWSALVFILMSSEKELFDLKEYCASEKGLWKLLPVVKVSKKAILSGCGLTSTSCGYLSSLLSSKSCCLKELDLSNNDLTDLGMKELASGLSSPQCKLEILQLSGCCLSEDGFCTLAAALKRNCSHIKELDVSYNHPGNKGLKEIFALQSAPQSKLETLSVDPTGRQWLIRDFMKYFTIITLDPKTVNKALQLSNYDKKVTLVLQDFPYPDHPDRFDYWHQVLSLAPMTDRCYQEVKWIGEVEIGLTYKRIQRKGHKEICRLGDNDHSWRLRASSTQCYVCHNKNQKKVRPIGQNRVGIFLDQPAGLVSFFSVSPNERIHLHTIKATFTDPLYLAFGLRVVPRPLVSSAFLCDLSHELPAIFTAQ